MRVGAPIPQSGTGRQHHLFVFVPIPLSVTLPTRCQTSLWNIPCRALRLRSSQGLEPPENLDRFTSSRDSIDPEWRLRDWVVD